MAMMKMLQRSPLVLSIDDTLSAEECAEWIERAEALGFRKGALISRHGVAYDDRVRSNERVVFDDPSWAALLFARLAAHFPRRRGWAPTGCNERIRIYRYEPGQRFREHRDSYFERPGGERSQLTLLVYLNDGFEGGETWFPKLTFSPERGAALAFEHDQPHAGVVVTAGRKYVARTDVMYFPDFSSPDDA